MDEALAIDAYIYIAYTLCGFAGVSCSD